MGNAQTNVNGMGEKKTKILVIAEDVDFDRTSGGLVNTKMIDVLACYFETHLVSVGKVPDAYQHFGLKSIRKFDYENSVGWKILAKIPLLRSLPEWFTGINHASWHKFLLWKKHLRHWLKGADIDSILIMGSGMGWYAHLAFAKLKTPSVPVLAAFHDPFPMALLPPPYTAPLDHGQKMLIKKMKGLIAKVDVCYAPSLRMLEHMAGFYPGLMQKSSVVPHLAMELPFLNATASANEGTDPLIFMLQQLHTQNHFLLVHMGSLLEGRSPAPFFKAVLQFLSLVPEAADVTKVVFIGKVHSKVESDFQLVAENTNFLIETKKRVSYSQSLALQKNASANLIIESMQFQSPQLFGKFADSVLADRPIICLGPAGSEARRLLGNDYPYQAANGNEQEIVQMLLQLFDKWKTNHDLYLNRPDLQQAFDPKRLIELVETTIESRQ